MPTARSNAEVRVRVKDDSARGFRSVNSRLDKLDRASRKFRAGGIALGTAIAGSAVAFSKYEKSLAEVNTLLSDTDSLIGYKKGVEELSSTFAVDRTATAKALYQVISAGASNAAEATTILTEANKLALGGVTDVTTAADGLTTVLNAYGIEAQNSHQASDAFFVAMKAGKTTVGELAANIGTVAPLAKTMGLSLDETLASVSALTKGGISTSEAMTQVRGILAAIVKPSEKAQKAAARLGIDFSTTALKTKGLSKFMAELQERVGGNQDDMAKLFGRVEALGGVLALTGEQADSFNSILEQMKSKSGAADAAVEKMRNTLDFKWNLIVTEVKNLGIAFGEQVAPALKLALDFLTPVVVGLGRMVTGVGQTIAALGQWVIGLEFVQGAASDLWSVFNGDVLEEMGADLTFIRDILGFVGDAFGGSKLAGIAMVNGILVSIEKLKFKWGQLTEFIKLKFTQAVDAVRANFAALVDKFQSGFEAVGLDFFADKLDGLSDQIEGTQDATEKYESAIADLTKTKDKAIDMINTYTDDLASAEVGQIDFNASSKKTEDVLDDVGDAAGKNGAAGEISTLDDSVKALIEQEEELLDKISAVDEAMRDGTISANVGETALRKYGETLGKLRGFGEGAALGIDSLTAAAVINEERIKRVNDLWEESHDILDDTVDKNNSAANEFEGAWGTVGDVIGGVLDEGLGYFDNFFDNVLNSLGDFIGNFLSSGINDLFGGLFGGSGSGGGGIIDTILGGLGLGGGGGGGSGIGGIFQNITGGIGKSVSSLFSPSGAIGGLFSSGGFFGAGGTAITGLSKLATTIGSFAPPVAAAAAAFFALRELFGGGARSFAEIIQEDYIPALFGQNVAGEALGANGETGFNGGNTAIFGANFGIDGSGITAQLLNDGGENGNGGFFTGAQRNLEEFAELLQQAGIEAEISGGVLRALSRDGSKTADDIIQIWEGYSEGLQEAVAFSEVFATATENNLLKPTNLFFEQFAIGFGQNAFAARESIVTIDSLFDGLVASGTEDSQALIQAFSEFYGITEQQAQEFFNSTGISIEQMTQQFRQFSGDALSTLLDFNAEGETIFDNIASSAVNAAGAASNAFSNELSGVLDNINLGSLNVPNPNVNISTDITTNPAQAAVTVPNLGGFSNGGSFTVPNTGRGSGDAPFLIGLSPNERVTVEPSNTTPTSDNSALMDMMGMLVTEVTNLTNEMNRVNGKENAFSNRQ